MNQEEFESLYEGLQAGNAESIKQVIQNGAYMLHALYQCMSPNLVCQEQREATNLMFVLLSLIKAGRLQIKNAEGEK